MFLIRQIKKIVNKLYYSGVFEILKVDTARKNNPDVLQGEACSIDASAILITNGNGKVILKGRNYIGRNTELQPTPGGFIKLGYGTSIQDRNVILGDVEFGKFCLTAPNVYLSSGRHYFDHNPYLYIRDQDSLVLKDPSLSKEHSKKITVEDDVWIGMNSVIMSGVTLGRGSVIGSNSVVTKDVPPFSVMAGAPAKKIKDRLEFVPKAALDFNTDSDLPNFYSGFFLDMKNLSEDRRLGGVSASNAFSLYMLNTGSKIKLTVKIIGDEPMLLCYNDQKIALSGKAYTDVSFDLAAVNYHRFYSEGDMSDGESKKILLAKAVILN